jgi:hypothetical protein
MGLEWYQSKANELLYCRRIFLKFFFFMFCPFKFKETVFSVLRNFRVAFTVRVARAD